MNELAGIYSIIKNKLNNRHYFKSLMKEGYNAGILTEQQIRDIQLSLLNLLTRQVNKYTSFESTSVRTEKAQEILESITYCIGAYLKTDPDLKHQLELLNPDNMDNLFSSGLAVIKESVTDSQLILEQLKEEAMDIRNLAYTNTIFHGIPDFYHDYDMRYAAQEGGGSIDYPLAIDITDLEGAEYIMEYLTRLTLENRFCCCFSINAIRQLLKGYHEDYADLLINIFEIVLTNGLGLVLLNRDIYPLEIDKDDRQELKTLLSGLKASELESKLILAVEELYHIMEFDDAELLSYMKRTVMALSQRLFHLLELDKTEEFFIAFKTEGTQQKPAYMDGEPMEDDKLRDLIETLKDLRYTSDKIAIIQREIHSLSDLAEVLDICFYKEEFKEVFPLLNEAEISYLLGFIDEEYEKEWQSALKMYALNHSAS
jgi:hypothetical protein